MTNNVSRFLKEEDGATAIEYGLIAAVISIGILATLREVTDALNARFNEVEVALDSA